MVALDSESEIRIYRDYIYNAGDSCSKESVYSNWGFRGLINDDPESIYPIVCEKHLFFRYHQVSDIIK